MNLLNRTTFATSRQLEFFSERELVAQTGCQPYSWPAMIIKELADNALDACENAGILPVISVEVTEDSITVTDNGPGLPYETLQGACNFNVRVSDKSRYVSPTRGQQGNAFKTILAVPQVLDGREGIVEISTGGEGFRVRVSIDSVRQEPRIDIQRGLPAIVKTGTAIRMVWPESACSVLEDGLNEVLQVLMGLAAFNPHLELHVRISCFPFRYYEPRTKNEWKKWLHRPLRRRTGTPWTILGS